MDKKINYKIEILLPVMVIFILSILIISYMNYTAFVGLLPQDIYKMESSQLILRMIKILIPGVILTFVIIYIVIKNTVNSMILNVKNQMREIILEERTINELENNLIQKQIYIMLSKIQPHFMYNSLSVIQQLCTINPKLAEETILEFSDFLRCNLDSLSLSEPVPFVRELRHIEAYLSLEKKRFGKKVRIVFNINYFDFKLPALTLQPIVENAVKYGIIRKENGGTVTIITEKDGDNIVVKVIDDGVGIDPWNTVQFDGRTHIGLENIRNRLVTMCGGSLEIQCKPGEGTIAVIIVPVKKGEKT